ncbi:putative cyclin-G1 [Apostichopus japonicus]|uniref:Putative cyclin-G1 n=1 Tax=Stichopus japonicus TaxID=307972 RepID=A0A2G8LI47_STIJA|nr:putative cyclin-G1 [Apostichopus japonicus]
MQGSKLTGDCKKASCGRNQRDWIVYKILTAGRLENVPNLHYIRNHREGSVTVAPYMHDVVIDRLRSLVRFYKLSPKSFFLSVSILDRFLSVVKVRALHLMCVTVSSFYMAVKLVEPRENVMSVKHLVRISQCGCLPNDVSRMEKIMSKRINIRDCDIPTSNHFLQLFVSYCHADEMLHFPLEELNQRLYKLVLKLEACLCHFALLQFRPCVLALSLLSHELPNLMAPTAGETENRGLSWIKVIWELQKITQISDTELLYCRAQVADCLRKYSSPVPKPSSASLLGMCQPGLPGSLHYTSKLAHHLPTIPECSSWRPEQESLLAKDLNLAKTMQLVVNPVPSLGKHPLQDATNTNLYCAEPRRIFDYKNQHLEFCPVNSTC